MTKKTLRVATGKPGAQGFDFTVAPEPLDAEGETGFWTRAVSGADGKIYLATQARVANSGGKRVSMLRTMTLTADASGALVKEASETVLEGAAAAEDDTAPRKEGGEVGGFLDLSISPEGEQLLTFYDGQQNRVGWVRRAKGAAWSQPEYLGAGTGPYSSGMVGQEGSVHLAYMTQEPATLSYQIAGSKQPAQVIANGLRDTGALRFVARVGEGVGLRLDAGGKPEVVYQDASLHKLMSAKPGPMGWKVSEVAAPGTPYSGAHGFYAVMLRGGEGSSLLVEYVIDGSAKPPKDAPSITAIP